MRLALPETSGFNLKMVANSIVAAMVRHRYTLGQFQDCKLTRLQKQNPEKQGVHMHRRCAMLSQVDQRKAWVRWHACVATVPQWMWARH